MRVRSPCRLNTGPTPHTPSANCAMIFQPAVGQANGGLKLAEGDGIPSPRHVGGDNFFRIKAVPSTYAGGGPPMCSSGHLPTEGCLGRGPDTTEIHETSRCVRMS